MTQKQNDDSPHFLQFSMGNELSTNGLPACGTKRVTTRRYDPNKRDHFGKIEGGYVTEEITTTLEGPICSYVNDARELVAELRRLREQENQSVTRPLRADAI